jgi:hypothetical protein
MALTSLTQRGPISSNSRTRETVAPGSTVGGWYYMGSHNFSAAAWVNIDLAVSIILHR